MKKLNILQIAAIVGLTLSTPIFIGLMLLLFTPLQDTLVTCLGPFGSFLMDKPSESTFTLATIIYFFSGFTMFGCIAYLFDIDI